MTQYGARPGDVCVRSVKLKARVMFRLGSESVFGTVVFSIVSFFTLFLLHQIFEHMHGVLNVDKKITNYIINYETNFLNLVRS